MASASALNTSARQKRKLSWTSARRVADADVEVGLLGATWLVHGDSLRPHDVDGKQKICTQELTIIGSMSKCIIQLSSLSIHLFCRINLAVFTQTLRIIETTFEV